MYVLKTQFGVIYETFLYQTLFKNINQQYKDKETKAKKNTSKIKKIVKTTLFTITLS